MSDPFHEIAEPTYDPDAALFSVMPGSSMSGLTVEKEP